MPNIVAYMMILIWPLVTIMLFRKLSIERALIWSILAAFLLLPPGTEYDFPLIPALDKTSIPNIAAFLICILMLKRKVPVMPASVIGKCLIVLFVISPIATVLTNQEPISSGFLWLPGQRIFDGISAMINQAIFILPFFLARSLLATKQAQRELLLAFVLGGLAYSIPMLLEIRLSPQLNIWVYGFFPHSFLQQIRFGGFRPVVFLGHGLLVAFFAMLSLLAAVSLWRRAEDGRRGQYMIAGTYLAVVLVLCKTVGAIVYAVALAPLIRFTSNHFQIKVAVVLATITLLYPMLRGADLVPVDAMLAQAEKIQPERAQSLGFRFRNEAILLEHASQKPLFGWGLWGRNEVYDPATGQSLTTADGRWVIVIGIFGWTGYLVEFGLLTLPLLLLWVQARHRRRDELSPYVGALSLLLAINLIDLLPNAALLPLTWLMAGSLLGYAEALKAGTVAEATPAVANPQKPQRGAMAFSRTHEPTTSEPVIEEPEPEPLGYARKHQPIARRRQAVRRK